MDNEGTLKKSIEGGKWIFLNTFFQKLISAASFFVLARLLLPHDFGIIAILFIVPSLMELFLSPDFSTAIIQKREDPYRYLNQIWTFNLCKSALAAILIFFGASFIAEFFGVNEAVNAIRLSSFIIIIPALANPAQIFFFKNIDFKKIFIRDILAAVSYSSVAIMLAFFLKSFWALFAGNAAQLAIASATTYSLHPFRPKISFGLKRLFGLWNYIKWLYGQGLVNRIVPSLENGLVAKMTNANQLGLFNRAKNLVSIPVSPFYNIIQRITFPAYARLQNSYEKIKDGFLKSLDVIFFVSVPTAILFFEASHNIILVLLGPNWVDMDIALKIFGLNLIFNIFPLASAQILNALGKSNTQFKLGLINLALLSIFMAIFVPLKGINGAAFAILLTTLCLSIVTMRKVMAVLKIKMKEIISPVTIPLFSSIVVLFIGRLLLKTFEPLNNFEFIGIVAFLGIIYVLLVVLSGIFVKRGPYDTLKLIFLEVFPKKQKNG